MSSLERPGGGTAAAATANDMDVYTSEYLADVLEIIAQCSPRDSDDSPLVKRVEAMVRGAPLRPKEAAVLLHWAAQVGNVPLMRCVLRHFPTSKNCPCAAADGNTALHIAAAEGHLAAVKFLVEKARVKTSARNDRGELAISVTRQYAVAIYLLRMMSLVRAASQPGRASMKASHANNLHGTRGGRLFDYLAFVEVGVGPPLRKRQMAQGWTPARVLTRFPSDDWPDFRDDEIDWCAAAQFIPHPEPGNPFFRHFRNSSVSSRSTPDDLAPPESSEVLPSVADVDGLVPDRQRYRELTKAAAEAVTRTRSDAENASIIADMLLDAEVELTQARSRGLNASATNARQALADRLRTELKQAKRQSQRSAQAAADAAQAVRDFERTYLSHGNDDNHRMRTATRQRASSNFVAALLSPPNEGAPVHSEAASVHHAESSVADLASGHNTWSSGAISWVSTDAHGDTYYCMAVYFPSPEGRSSSALILVSHCPVFTLGHSLLQALVELTNLPHSPQHGRHMSSEANATGNAPRDTLHRISTMSFFSFESAAERLRRAIPAIFQLCGLNTKLPLVDPGAVAKVAASADSTETAISMLVKAAVYSPMAKLLFAAAPDELRSLPEVVGLAKPPRRLCWNFFSVSEGQYFSEHHTGRRTKLSVLSADLPPEASLQANALPFLEHHALELLMRFLSPSSIASLIGALLVEHNVLLLARDIELLAPVAEALRSLLFPLRWVQVYIPLLPRPFLSMVQSPVPFIMGTHIDNYSIVSQHLSALRSADAHGTYVVNLHRDEVVPPILYSSQGAPSPPEALRLTIMWALQDRGSIQHSIDTLLATAVEHSMPREPAEPRLEPRLHASARHAQHVVLSDSNPFDDRSRWTCFDLSLPLNGKGKLGLVLRRATARSDRPTTASRASSDTVFPAYLMINGFREDAAPEAPKVLNVGDVIESIDGRRTCCTQDVKAALKAGGSSVRIRGFRAVSKRTRRRKAGPTGAHTTLDTAQAAPKSSRWKGGMSRKEAVRLRGRMLEAMYLLLGPMDFAFMLIESPSDKDRRRALRHHPLGSASSKPDVETDEPIPTPDTGTGNIFLNQFLCTSMFQRFGTQCLCIDDDQATDLQAQLNLFLRYAQIRNSGNGRDSALIQCFPGIFDSDGAAWEDAPVMHSGRWYSEVGQFLFHNQADAKALPALQFAGRYRFHAGCAGDEQAVANCVNAFQSLVNVRLRRMDSPGSESDSDDENGNDSRRVCDADFFWQASAPPILPGNPAMVSVSAVHGVNNAKSEAGAGSDGDDIDCGVDDDNHGDADNDDSDSEWVWSGRGRGAQESPAHMEVYDTTLTTTSEDTAESDNESVDSVSSAEIVPHSPSKPPPPIPTNPLDALNATGSVEEIAARFISPGLFDQTPMAPDEMGVVQRGVAHLAQSLCNTSRGRAALHAQAQELRCNDENALRFLVQQVETRLVRKVLASRADPHRH